MADSHDLADANSDTFWEEEELDEHESEYFSTDYGAPAHSANENMGGAPTTATTMTDALRFNGEKFIIAAQYIAKQRAKLHHQLRKVCFSLFFERMSPFVKKCKKQTAVFSTKN